MRTIPGSHYGCPLVGKTPVVTLYYRRGGRSNPKPPIPSDFDSGTPSLPSDDGWNPVRGDAEAEKVYRVYAQALAATTARVPLGAPPDRLSLPTACGGGQSRATCAPISCSCRRVLVSGVGGDPANLLFIRTYSYTRMGTRNGRDEGHPRRTRRSTGGGSHLGVTNKRHPASIHQIAAFLWPHGSCTRHINRVQPQPLRRPLHPQHGGQRIVRRWPVHAGAAALRCAAGCLALLPLRGRETLSAVHVALRRRRPGRGRLRTSVMNQ